MRVPKILKSVAAALVIVAMIRAVFGAGHINLYDILLDVSSFQYDVSFADEFTQFLESGGFSTGLYEWHSPTGVSDFLQQIGNTLSGFFTTCGQFFRSIGVMINGFFIQTAKGLFRLLRVVLRVLGIMD